MLVASKSIILLRRTNLTGFSSCLAANFGSTNRKKAERYDKYMKNYLKSQSFKDEDRRSVSEIAASIDTTLTSEQKEYVATIRRKIRGGDRTPRSLYREVPLPHEIKGDGGFMPNIPPNADALIDYALSHIPVRGGPRGTRRKKRLARKAEAIKKINDKKKEGQKNAIERKQAKLRRIRLEVKQVREQAAALRLKASQAKQ